MTMGFITDKQTLDDLNLLGRFRKDSVINIFDRTKTRQGRRILEEMFRNPLTDADGIRARSREFRYYSGKGFTLPVDESLTEPAELYLGASSSRSSLAAALKMVVLKVRGMFVMDKEYDRMQSGMTALAAIVSGTVPLWERLSEEDSPVKEDAGALSGIFGGKVAGLMSAEKEGGHRSLRKAIALDRLLRVRLYPHVRRMLDLLYRLDVFFSVAGVAEEKGFCLAGIHPGEDSFLEIDGVWHPSLKNAVPNDIRIDSSSNVFFLTGVNMAGKSTFMKTVSIALYLAQMGFPVPASRMEFTPVEGLFTSINVADDIASGYSHFYAEVLRVKHLAEQVRSGRRLLLVFDELFKGTNVKDAHDATLAVTEAFARHRECLYVISTHIVEAGQELSERCGNVTFRYFPASLDGDRPVYPYRLEEGISDDRYGMTIIRHEKILDIIRGYRGESQEAEPGEQEPR